MMKENVHLPFSQPHQKTWFWIMDWKVDVENPLADDEGWQYARSFEEPEGEWTSISPTSGVGGWVRRRRWFRVRKLRTANTAEPKRRDSTDDLVTSSFKEQSLDYISRAQKIISDRIQLVELDESAIAPTYQEELQCYEQAIQTLLAGLKCKYLKCFASRMPTLLLAERNPEKTSYVTNLVASLLEHAEEVRAKIDPSFKPVPKSTPKNFALDDLACLRNSLEGMHYDDNESSALRKAKGTAATSESEDVVRVESLQESPDSSTSVPLGLKSSDISTFVPVEPCAVVRDRLGDESTGPSDSESIEDTFDRHIWVHPTQWQPDKDAPECHTCHRKFSFWIRRHHCRSCVTYQV
jgi:hypothetical protein